MSAMLVINIHNGTGNIYAGSEHHELPAAAQWQVISREPARLQLTDGERARLFAPEVEKRADELFTRPYHLTLDIRRWIADELDGLTQ